MRQNRQAKNNHAAQQHEFAFFYPRVTVDLAGAQLGSSVIVADANVFHRVSRVLRLEPGQEFILFDRVSSVHLQVQGFKGERVHALVCSSARNLQLAPRVTFLLPLLKREQFQDALYSLVELGVNVVQPVVTQKTQRAWSGEHEYERSMNIMVAAAEQSKHFSFSELEQPRALEDCCRALDNSSAKKLFFDPCGQPVTDVLKKISGEDDIVLLIGPEGDLTEQEKEMLHAHGFYFCALTPTVLRASQAVTVALGIVRSCVR